MNASDQTSAGSLAATPELVERVDRHLAVSGLLSEGSGITIALSGGLDSVVLLDLCRVLAERWNWEISAAHFDHRMRETSESDAEWVRTLCEKLDVSFLLGRAASTPRSEAHARELRYEFLLEARAKLGGRWLATAHQADDQAETVLFRILRGTGPLGLRGIPPARPPCLVRPLLPFWRVELEDYATGRSLEFRLDPTNIDTSITRNRIRHRLIPEVERQLVPDFRRRLHRLAEAARGATPALERFSERAADELVLEATESHVVVARSRFRLYDTQAQAFLLRSLVARVGQRPSRVGTRVALEFIKDCTSGRRIELAGGVIIRREFDRLIFERMTAGVAASDRALVVPGPGDGAGEAWIGGARWAVRWTRGGREGHGETESAFQEVNRFDLSALRFPLTVRSWQPGDRIHLPAGTRKLKKLFVERRVGQSERAGYPLVVDGTGVLWVVGLARGVRGVVREGDDTITMTCSREDG